MNEETRDSVLVSDRSSLLVTVENEDPVTGYPFETIGVRERLIGIFQQAIDGGRALVFINGDIDNLKTLNDSYGYSFANQAIKETVQQKEACLLGIDGAEVYVYRPQAGGDEFKAIVVVEQKPEEGINALIQLIKEKFNQLLQLEKEDGKTVEINSSYGIVAKQFLGDEEAAKEFQTMENEAERRLIKAKLEKIDREIRETVITGKKLSIEDYIEELVKRWGAKRFSEEGLRIILFHFSAKLIQQFSK